jgi:hypothetical protein
MQQNLLLNHLVGEQLQRSNYHLFWETQRLRRVEIDQETGSSRSLASPRLCERLPSRVCDPQARHLHRAPACDYALDMRRGQPGVD